MCSDVLCFLVMCMAGQYVALQRQQELYFFYFKGISCLTKKFFLLIKYILIGLRSKLSLSLNSCVISRKRLITENVNIRVVLGIGIRG